MNDLRKGAAIAKAVDIAGDTARTANVVDKLNDTRKVANAADKAVDVGKAGAAWVTGEATLAVVDYLTAGTYSAATKGMGLIIGAASSESMYKDSYYTVTTYKRQGANSTQVVTVVEEYADANKTKLVHRSVTNPVDVPNSKTNN